MSSLTRVAQRGFSLVEMMIAMTVGLVLLTGMIAVFSGNKRSSDMNAAMANIQENARFALSQIARDIRMSGYQGCMDMNNGGELFVKAQASPTTNFLSDTATTGSVVQGDGSWAPAPPGAFAPPVANPAIPGTHTIALQFGIANQARLTGPMTAGGIPSESGDVVVDLSADTTNSLAGMTAGDLAIISDCTEVNLFTASATSLVGTTLTLSHAASHNLDGNLTKIFGEAAQLNDTRILRFASNIYYIGDTGLTNENGDQIRALYQQSLPYNDPANPPVELVQGVENMRVAFGVRSATGSLQYVPADDPAYNPSAVESVQIGLLMTSWDRIAQEDDDKTYILAGQQIASAASADDGLNHAEDRRFRLAFNTTIKVRNRR